MGKSCPIGKHFETIYLVNADGIATPLPLSITVTGEMPDWKVETYKFSTTMNLVATVSVHGVPSNDTDNIIGAFIDGECRGVAQPTYSKRYDEYFAMLDIAGNAGDKGKKSNSAFTKPQQVLHGPTYRQVKTFHSLQERL